MTSARAHCVPVYPLSLDPTASPSLQCFVNAEYQRAITPIEVLNQEPEAVAP